jgi:hypothetical protein
MTGFDEPVNTAYYGAPFLSARSASRWWPITVTEGALASTTLRLAHIETEEAEP